ncbi:hypothetical protein CMV_004810 [Castanea mollissima]|uniref:Uncharacterized protein n=1 Tax=Castanea mollissima TaxID=60419 RepID=A0A8J4RY87_9ROSI|nr:hypothetical protein CMV_004810 [Castanea mollissima]
MVKSNSDSNKTNDSDTSKIDEDLDSHETGSFKPDRDSVKFSPDINSIASSAVIPILLYGLENQGTFEEYLAACDKEVKNGSVETLNLMLEDLAGSIL